MKAYWKFAEEWKIVGAQGYVGPAIISRDGIYLVPYRESSKAGTAAAAMGGVVGAMLSVAVSEKAGETGLAESGVIEQALEEVDKSVTGHRDWPIKKIKDERVVVIPKPLIIEWKFPWWSGLTLRLPEGRQIFFSPSIRQWTVRKYFREFEYPEMNGKSTA